MNYKNIKNKIVFKIILILIGISFISIFFISKINIFNYKIIPVNKNKTTQKELYIDKKNNKKKEDLKEEKKKTERLVVLEVLGRVYKTETVEGDSVYDVMKKLSKLKKYNFSFNSKNYSSLGVFINKINGIKGSLGKYWIYYINNKKASVGVSKYILKPNDIINWKQESE